MHARLLALGAVALSVLSPLALAGPPADAIERTFDAAGRLLAERGIVPGQPDVAFERHYFHVATEAAQASGGGKPGPAPIPGNDCAATAYKTTGWRWTGAYSAYSTTYLPEADRAARAWDDNTSRAIFGGVTAGSLGVAGAFDGVNQLDWVDLGATSTIAVTTTWYNRFTRIAVESDGQYNTRYAWASDGSATAMDAENILAHEIGHTLGLDHPRSTSANACLTMYAYADFGETTKRSLGSGDVHGIRAVYGA